MKKLSLWSYRFNLYTLKLFILLSTVVLVSCSLNGVGNSYLNKVVGNSSQPDSLSDGVVFATHLDGTSGSVVDNSPTGASGTINGTVSRGVAGKLGKAFTFAGNSSTYVDFGDNSAWHLTNKGSISCWFKTTANTSGKYVALAGNGPFGGSGNSGSSDGFGLLMDEGAGQIQLKINNGGSFDHVTSSESGLNDGAWHLAVGTFNGTTVKLYVDGSLAASTSQTITMATWENFIIGNDYEGLSYAGFPGTIDEVDVWNRALSESEVSQLWNSGNGFGYPFDGSYNASVDSVGSGGSGSSVGTSPYPGYNLVWSDEFNESSLNTSKWNVSDNRYMGAGELAYFWNRTQNVSVKNGNLVITALNDNYNGHQYSSGRIYTKGKFEFNYGRVDIRAKLPVAQGMWPALWMFSNTWDIDHGRIGTNQVGEIDILELIGTHPARAYQTLHWFKADNTYSNLQFHYDLTSGDFSQKYHVFSLIWNANQIQFLVDGNVIGTTTVSSYTNLYNGINPFTNGTPFYLIFNLAVGGNWPGNPDGTTTFPQKMYVDYVRVYQKN